MARADLALSQIDAFALEMGRGVMAGLQSREAERRDQRAAELTLTRDQDSRAFTRERADLQTAQQYQALGYDVPEQAPAVEARFAPQREPAAAMGRERRLGLGTDAARRVRAVQLDPSYEQRRAEIDPFGGGPLQPGPTAAQQVAPTARRIVDAFGLPDEAEAVVGDFVPTRQAEGADPLLDRKRAQIDADIEAKMARAARDKRPTPPRVTRGTPPPDDVKLAIEEARALESEWKTSMQQSQSAFKEGVAARSKTVAGGSPSIEQMKVIEDSVALPLLEALAPMLDEDIRIPANAAPGTVAARYKAALRTRFDRERARNEAIDGIKRLREPDAFPRGAAAPATTGPAPARDPTDTEIRDELTTNGQAYGINLANTRRVLGGNYSEQEKAKAREDYATAREQAAANIRRRFSGGGAQP